MAWLAKDDSGATDEYSEPAAPVDIAVVSLVVKKEGGRGRSDGEEEEMESEGERGSRTVKNFKKFRKVGQLGVYGYMCVCV